MNFLTSPRLIPIRLLLSSHFIVTFAVAVSFHKRLPSFHLFPWKEPQPIFNLDRYLLPLLHLQGQGHPCLLFLNNFLQVDIHPLPYQPVILHEPIPTVTRLVHFSSTLKENFVLAHLIEGQRDNQTGTYKYSQLLSNFPPPLKAKPWNSVVTVDLYPPRTPSPDQLSEWFNDQQQPIIFAEETPYASWKINLHYYAEKYLEGITSHVLVVERELLEGPSLLRMLKSILEQAARSPLLTGIKQYQKTVEVFLLEVKATESKIASWGKMDICLHCSKFIKVEKFSGEISPAVAGRPGERPLWLVRSSNGVIHDLLSSCRTSLGRGSHRDLTRVISQVPFPNEQLLHAALHIWSHFIQNDSYRVESSATSKICGGGNFYLEELQSQFQLEEGHVAPLLTIGLDEPPRPHYLPYYFENIFNATRFISCGGKEEFTRTAFGELISSYDKPSWILILMSCAGFSVTLRNLGGRYGWTAFASNAFAFLKIFMEQGDPISDQLLRKGTQRIIAGTFLLSGILFSNGYKNQNVYNMVLPREPIHYERLQQLLRDNFTIYVPSRSTSFGKYYETDIKYNRPEKVFKNGRHFRSFLSDGIWLDSVSGFFRPYLRSGLNYYWEGEFKRQEALMNNTDLIGLDLAKKLAVQVVEELEGNVSSEESGWKYFYPEKEYQRREGAELFRILSDCNRAALVLPSQQCLEYAGTLRGKRVSVGREDYRVNEQSFAFHFQGFIPKHVLSRLGLLKQSGLRERWTRLLSETSHRSGEEVGMNDPEAAKLDGNIVVVFAVLGCGFLAAFLGFFLEHFKKA